MKGAFFCLVLFSVIYGCGMNDWKIEELSVQKIDGSSKVIYYFSAWGGLDSNPHGFIVLDSTEEFTVDVNKILPIYYLSEIPSSEKLKAFLMNVTILVERIMIKAHRYLFQ